MLAPTGFHLCTFKGDMFSYRTIVKRTRATKVVRMAKTPDP
jgi:hypothetical protein